MQETQLRLRMAGEADLGLIGQLATRIWNEHYTPIIGSAQVTYMLQLMYSESSLREQMTVKHHSFWLLETAEGVMGFISLHEQQPGDWFLNKFYILREKAGRGLGSTVLKEIHELLQPRKITLTVNRQNHKSINFYFKNGFTIDQVADFDIGQGYVMNDFVMVWTNKS